MILKRVARLVFSSRHGANYPGDRKATKVRPDTVISGLDKEGRIKPDVWSYYSRREIATLFLQPFSIIIIYLTSVWYIFKYYCGIKDVQQFMNRIKWIRGNARLEDN